MRQTKIHLSVFTYEHKTKQNTLVCLFLRAQDKAKETCLSLLTKTRQIKRNLSVFTYEHKTNQYKLVLFLLKDTRQTKIN